MDPSPRPQSNQVPPPTPHRPGTTTESRVLRVFLYLGLAWFTLGVVGSIVGPALTGREASDARLLVGTLHQLGLAVCLAGLAASAPRG